MQARWISADIWPFTCVPLPRAFLEDLHPGLSFRLEALGGYVRASATGRSPVLNHSDLHREHLFIESERLSGVIDFGGAFVGSPAWEFAAIALFLGWGAAATVHATYVVNGGADISLDEVALLAAAFGTYRLRVEHRLGNGATVGVEVLRFLFETLERLA